MIHFRDKSNKLLLSFYHQVFVDAKESSYTEDWNQLEAMRGKGEPILKDDRLITDIRQPIPLESNAYEFVYAMRCIEHLTEEEADTFLSELYRILKPGGLLRVSCPDLEDIIRVYNRFIKTIGNNPSDKQLLKHQWLMLEFQDQMVRQKSGGRMMEMIAAGAYDPEFAKERYGDVFESFIPREAAISAKPQKLSMTQQLKHNIKKRLPFMFPQKPVATAAHPWDTLECNKWMYDEFTLADALKRAGFINFQKQTPDHSQSPDWNKYMLDTSNKGSYPFEPSLYMECIKPKGV